MDIPIGGHEQCKDRAYGITKIVRAATVPRLLDEGWLSNPDDSGVSLSLSLFRLLLFFFFTAIADDNSRQGCATRSAINTLGTIPSPCRFFDPRWWFHVPTCCFSIPCYGNRGKEKKNDHALSAPAILNSKSGGGGRRRRKGGSDCLWKTRVS